MPCVWSSIMDVSSIPSLSTRPNASVRCRLLVDLMPDTACCTSLQLPLGLIETLGNRTEYIGTSRLLAAPSVNRTRRLDPRISVTSSSGSSSACSTKSKSQYATCPSAFQVTDRNMHTQDLAVDVGKSSSCVLITNSQSGRDLISVVIRGVTIKRCRCNSGSSIRNTTPGFADITSAIRISAIRSPSDIRA